MQNKPLIYKVLVLSHSAELNSKWFCFNKEIIDNRKLWEITNKQILLFKIFTQLSSVSHSFELKPF